MTRPAGALSFGNVPANTLTSPAIVPNKDVQDEVAEIASVLEDLLLGVDESKFMYLPLYVPVRSCTDHSCGCLIMRAAASTSSSTRTHSSMRTHTHTTNNRMPLADARNVLEFSFVSSHVFSLVWLGETC